MKLVTLKSRHKITNSLTIMWSTYFTTYSIRWRWSDRKCVSWTREVSICADFWRQCEFFI